MSIPTHAEWKVLKKKHDVAEGAVSGMDLGKVLDTYHGKLVPSAKAAVANAALAETATGQLANYITKLDAKKVKKDFPGFKATFLNKYVGAAKAATADWKRYSADAATYKTELVTFFSMVPKLTPGQATQAQLNEFLSGPLRGLGAVGSGLKGFDLTALVALQGEMSVAINGLPANASRAALDQVITNIRAVTQRMAVAAKAANLL